MQKYLRAQAVMENDDTQSQFANIFNQAVLEINPNHPIMMKLKLMYEENAEDEVGKELVNLVFNTAALAAGYVLDNAAEYSLMVNKMLTKMVQS
jgi:HSP90 family molecular chaperone